MIPDVRHFLFLLASTRPHGNSELLAQQAARHLPTTASQQWLQLMDLPLPEFADLRHDVPYPVPEGNARLLLDATLAATDIVLVTPLYWYTMSVPAKRYLDYWSNWMRQPQEAFRERMVGKTLWAVVASSGTPEEAAPLGSSLQLSANYMAMRWGGLLLGNGSRPGDVLQDNAALRAAEIFWGEAS